MESTIKWHQNNLTWASVFSSRLLGEILSINYLSTRWKWCCCKGFNVVWGGMETLIMEEGGQWISLDSSTLLDGLNLFLWSWPNCAQIGHRLFHPISLNEISMLVLGWRFKFMTSCWYWVVSSQIRERKI